MMMMIMIIINTKENEKLCIYQYLQLPIPAVTNTCIYQYLQLPIPAGTVQRDVEREDEICASFDWSIRKN